MRKAELIGTLDEKYVANSLTFAAMHAAGTLIVDATNLRGEDGALDHPAIRHRVERLSWFAPAMRQRLLTTPLRATTPAWAPVDTLDLNYHVRFHDCVEPDDPERVELLTGRLSPTMDLKRPLWDFLFVELDSGRVAIVVRYHHVVGDALYGLRIGDVLAGTVSSVEPPEPSAAEHAELGTAPHGGLDVLGLTFATWRQKYPTAGTAWRGYWHKPFRMRLRRWGGRLLRPIKNARIARSGMLDTVQSGRHSNYVVVDLSGAMKRAYRLGGTLNDLTVAATLHAVATQRPEVDEVSMLVPISRRVHGDTTVRNDISVVKVTVPAGESIEALVPLVRDQVQRAVDSGRSIVNGAEDWVGYATYVTWGRDQRYFGAAPVEAVMGWPAGDPRDEIACLACSYRKDLVVSVTARDSIDIDAFMASVERSLSAPHLAPLPNAAGKR
ncbi:wax ester/triacylglycerol synthase domain-containing protein [Micromonospora sp. DT81.3]|uniref:wax ester/triacylglycerol synthase domain-containing protein n=1 Tax=Micromonospora sp. DT81.3 TaxID=3416523 RepID=UPI003CEC36B2